MQDETGKESKTNLLVPCLPVKFVYHQPKSHRKTPKGLNKGALQECDQVCTVFCFRLICGGQEWV